MLLLWVPPAGAASPAAAHADTGAQLHTLQGLYVGASAGLILYGLALWARWRSARVAWFTLLALGSTAYFACVSGLGALAGWGNDPAALVGSIAPLCSLLAAAGACGLALNAPHRRAAVRWRARCWRSGLVLAGLTAGLVALGLLPGAAAHAVAAVLTVSVLLLALPARREKRRASDARSATPDGGRAAATADWPGWPVLALALVATLVGALRAGLYADALALHTAQSASLMALALGMAVLRSGAPDVQRGLHQPTPQTAQGLGLALPGLLDRQALQAAWVPLQAQCTAQQAWAVFCVELEGFKTISDSLGHTAAGVLRLAAAERLQSHLRSTDLVCHLQGPSFALVVGPLSEEADREARSIQNKLQKAFEQPFSSGHNQCCLGLKSGFACARGPQPTLDALLQRAQLSASGFNTTPPLSASLSAPVAVPLSSPLAGAAVRPGL